MNIFFLPFSCLLMLFCEMMMHLMGAAEQLWPFPPCGYCTFKGHLSFMSTVTRFQGLFGTSLLLDLRFKLQVFLIRLLFSSFNERDESVIFVTDCPLLLPFDPFLLEDYCWCSFCHLLKGKLSTLTCQLALSTASVSLSILREAHQSGVSPSPACV